MLVDVVMGQSPPGEAVSTERLGLPLLNGPTEFGGHHPEPVQFTSDIRRKASKGDLLFCVRGSTTGRMNWADQDYAIGRGIASIRHKDSLELQPFIRAVVEFGLPELLAAATGSTFPNVSRDQLLGIPTPNFGLDDQKQIAHILGTLDDKIEVNRRMAVTLEEMARAIFKSWFIDFDPVRAKAESRPTHLPPDLEALFPESFEDSDLGPIPRGWKVGTLGDVAVQQRRTVRAEQITADTPYIALEHMPKRSTTLSEWDSGDGLASNKSAFMKGELLFGKLRPYFHKMGVAPLDGVCSTDIVVAAPKIPEWFGFVLGHMSSDEFVEHTNAGATGTKMPRTNWYDMARYPVVMPPLEIAGRFSEWYQGISDRLMAGTFESRTLTKVRDALLPKLIGGELRFGAREPLVEETVVALSGEVKL